MMKIYIQHCSDERQGWRNQREFPYRVIIYMAPDYDVSYRWMLRERPEENEIEVFKGVALEKFDNRNLRMKKAA
jgi:hypothetical protein